jgi:MurNAc alpha-1-phosphate uridylyltransferase
MINNAFILCAGHGTRLRPYTNDRPKPMVEICGKSLIHHALDHLKDHGVKDVGVNLHYMAKHLESHLQDISTPQIHISHEAELLNTGGGLKKGLALLSDDPCFVLSGDAFWSNNSQKTALQQLEDFWNSENMDILMLLQPVSSMDLTHGVGDYALDDAGHCTRSMDQTGKHMFTSLRIIHPRIFENTSDDAFSFLELMDSAEKAGRLYGVVHDGDWHHISTPKDLEAVNAALQTSCTAHQA